MDIKGGQKYSSSELARFISSAPVRLYPSLKSKIFLLAIAVIFVAGGAWMTSLGKINNEMVPLAVGTLSIVFFGPIGLLMIKKFSAGQPTLELCNDGFYDCQNLKGQLVKWSEISDVVTYTQNHNTFLGFFVKNPEQTFQNLSKIKRWGLNSNRKLGFPDLVYPQTLLGGQKAHEVAIAVSVFIK